MSSETIIEEIFKEEESEGTDWLKIIDKVDKILDKPSIKKIRSEEHTSELQSH